jgi:hypothetical protein
MKLMLLFQITFASMFILSCSLNEEKILLSSVAANHQATAILASHIEQTIILHKGTAAARANNL